MNSKRYEGYKSVLQSALEGSDVEINGDNPWDIRVNNPQFYKGVVENPEMELGDSYIRGWWDSERLDQTVEKVMSSQIKNRLKLSKNPIRLVKLLPAYLKNRVNRRKNQQSVEKSKRVAEQHYNLGNEFYEAMLGPTMQYTCAFYPEVDQLSLEDFDDYDNLKKIWEDPELLDKAQENKMRRGCEKLELGVGDNVLEIGGGWGGFGRFMVDNYGVVVDMFNISGEQVRYAKERNDGRSMNIYEEDYREAFERFGIDSFDKVASIGVWEHVGRINYRDSIVDLSKMTRPGGRILIHTIGRNFSDEGSNPWISKYIFPGGELPSNAQMSHAFEGLLVEEDMENKGPHYRFTLMAWHHNYSQSFNEFGDESGKYFQERWGDRFKPPYDRRFDRMWEFYLKSCAGGFASRELQLWQKVLSPSGLSRGYNKGFSERIEEAIPKPL